MLRFHQRHILLLEQVFDHLHRLVPWTLRGHLHRLTLWTLRGHLHRLTLWTLRGHLHRLTLWTLRDHLHRLTLWTLRDHLHRLVLWTLLHHLHRLTLWTLFDNGTDRSVYRHSRCVIISWSLLFCHSKQGNCGWLLCASLTCLCRTQTGRWGPCSAGPLRCRWNLHTQITGFTVDTRERSLGSPLPARFDKTTNSSTKLSVFKQFHMRLVVKERSTNNSTRLSVFR